MAIRMKDERDIEAGREMRMVGGEEFSGEEIGRLR